MANSNTTNRRFVKQVTGENADTWGDYINDNWDLLDKNLSQAASISVAGTGVTLTDTNQENLCIHFQGSLTANVAVTMTNKAGFWIFYNLATVGSYKITVVGNGGGTGIEIPYGAAVLIYSNGTTAIPIWAFGNVTAGNIIGRATGTNGAVGEIPLRYTSGGWFGANCTPVVNYTWACVGPSLWGASAPIDAGISANHTVVGTGAVQQSTTGVAAQAITHTVAGTQTAILFRQGSPASSVGSITVTGLAATAYNTSSDYRLKENVEPISNGLALVLRLRPCRFNFIVDPGKTRMDGFLAHEAQAVVPSAVTGEKNGEAMQQMDAAKLVPILTAGLQELHTVHRASERELHIRIRALEARLKEIEAKTP